jgi:uncharacterized protein
MKTSLDHLPIEKQQEIKHIAQIIKEVVNPEKIILFGSYAKGTYVEDRYRAKDGITYEYISDYDFLVVTKNNPEKTYVQESTILDRVDRYKPPVNLEIHDIEYINEGLDWGQYFFIDILDEGILLHDTANYQFKKARQLSIEEQKKRSSDYFNVWFPKSTGFVKGVKFYLKENELNIAAFNLHQAIESLYYSVLLVFTGYKPKTHNLWKLRKKTKEYSVELFSVFNAETNKADEHLFDLLKRSYLEARYKPQDYVITELELISLIEKAEKMIEIVGKICQERIDSLR